MSKPWNNGQTNPYGSHIPILSRMVMETKGDIVELGGGDFSTPILHNLLSLTNRKLLTFEEDAAWARRLSAYKSDNHRILHVTDWGKFLTSFTKDVRDLSIVFIDCEIPATVHETRYELRKLLALGLRETTEVLIMHDTEEGVFTGTPEWVDFCNSFEYQHTDKTLVPWTTVLSDTIDLDEIFWRK